jgi:hypothetical protein
MGRLLQLVIIEAGAVVHGIGGTEGRKEKEEAAAYLWPKPAPTAAESILETFIYPPGKH